MCARAINAIVIQILFNPFFLVNLKNVWYGLKSLLYKELAFSSFLMATVATCSIFGV